MRSLERAGEAFDLFCIAAGRGTLGLAAAAVVAVREADAPAEDVPSLDLAPLLGPGARGSSSRRIRVAAREAPAFDLVTDGALSVRSAARSSLRPVPPWLAPLVAPISTGQIVIDEGELVLLADPSKLAALCEHPAPPRAGAAPGEAERSHG